MQPIKNLSWGLNHRKVRIKIIKNSKRSWFIWLHHWIKVQLKGTWPACSAYLCSLATLWFHSIKLLTVNKYGESKSPQTVAERCFHCNSTLLLTSHLSSKPDRLVSRFTTEGKSRSGDNSSAQRIEITVPLRCSCDEVSAGISCISL